MRVPTPRAKRAIVRRLFLISGVILGVVFALWQRTALYRVSAVDFAQRQRNEYGWTGRRQMEPTDYIRDRTEGHLLRRDGQGWLDLYREVVASGEYRFFLPSRRPLDEVAGHLNGSFSYVALEHAGTPVYLEVVASRPGDVPAAPVHLRYPLRRFALAVFLAGLLGYFLIPWPKREPDVVAYVRFNGTVLPDLGLGVLFTGVFFALPWFIVPGEAGTSHPLIVDGGWIILTLVMWGFCLFGLAIHGVAAWYEVLRVGVAGNHLVIETLRAVERVDFADIERVDLAVREPPGLLVRAGWLVSLLNWRALGPTLLVASRSDPVIEFVLRDGRRRRLGLTAMCHLDRLISSLKGAGVTVDPGLEP